MAITPSKYQQAIYDWIDYPNGNLSVEAVAGSGKTTTIVEALHRDSMGISSVRFVAFNKHIADELQRRVPPNVEACTLNSFGFKILRANTTGYVKLDKDKTAKILQWQVMDFKNLDKESKREFWQSKNAICKIVSLLKACNITEFDSGIIEDLTIKYGIEIPELKVFDWYNLLKQTWAKAISQRNVIDFDDQIFYPILFGWEIPKTDFAFIDEAQDLNAVQIELISKMALHVVAVGDSRQAIYGFRGADPDAFANLKKKLHTTDLPLSICYRCAKNIVDEARKIVPQIESYDGAEDGSVEVSKDFNPVEGDYVLCRVTAPLVTGCLKLLQEGKKATVLGRDIGQNLIATIEALTTKTDISEFLEALSEYRSKESSKLEKRNKDTELMALNDRCDTLVALSHDAETVRDLINTINKIFSDEKNTGIVFCTVHKAKGLEADRIFVIQPELMPHPLAKLEWQQTQEMNLKYVAITRAKKELFFVTTET